MSDLISVPIAKALTKAGPSYSKSYIRGTGKSFKTSETHKNQVPAPGQDSPAPELHILQHEVSWYEQTVLRMLGIKHTVSNSEYNSYMSVGFLPAWMDLDKSVLTGAEAVDIVQFLSDCYHIDMNEHCNKIESKGLISLFKNELEPIALAFHYELSQDHLKRRKVANGGSISLIRTIQTWAKNTTQISKLRHTFTIPRKDNGDLDEGAAKSKLFELYSLFNEKLADGRDFFLIDGSDNNSKPSQIDALMYAHLCDCSSSGHLLPLVYQFDHLVYFHSKMSYLYFTAEGGGFEEYNNDFKQQMADNDVINFNNKYYPKSDIIVDEHQLKVYVNEEIIIQAAKAPTKAGQNLERLRFGGPLIYNHSKEMTVDDDDTHKRARNERIMQAEENDSIWWLGVSLLSGLFFLIISGQNKTSASAS